MHSIKFIILLTIFGLLTSVLQAQTDDSLQGPQNEGTTEPLNEENYYDQEDLWLRHMQGDSTVLRLKIIENDTIPMVNLGTISIIEKRFNSPEERYQFLKLRRNIIKVYPYARKAARLMGEIEEITADMGRKRQKKRYLRKLEKELKNQFESKLKDLTVSQGKTLIKLVERDTGKTCHELIKSHKNPVSAFFWQQLGKRFGYDLKEGYNPENYRDIEIILNNLQATGELDRLADAANL